MPDMPKFTKSPPAVIAAFEAASPSRPGVERRSMFGCPALFLNGNMFAFAFGPRIAVRLDVPGRAKAAKAGAPLFEMMPGRPMAEYIDLPGSAMRVPALRKWIAEGLSYAETLPAKVGKKTANATKATGAKTSRKRPAANKPIARKT
jgi:TfoX/Sxy family transcriptional regulator of competence genes